MAPQGTSPMLAPAPPLPCQRCRAQRSGLALRSSRRRRTTAHAGKLPSTGYFSEADPNGAHPLCMLAKHAEAASSDALDQLESGVLSCKVHIRQHWRAWQCYQEAEDVSNIAPSALGAAAQRRCTRR